MGKSLKIGLIILLVVFVAMQFYRPNKNIQKPPTTDDFLIANKAPQHIRDIMEGSCYNCHSNKTDYYWFNHIAPASWIVDNHIKRGKQLLNYSEWATKGSYLKKSIVASTEYNIMNDMMPLEEYVMLHPEAELSESEKQQLSDWLKTINTN